jgi:hypothetical protein
MPAFGERTPEPNPSPVNAGFAACLRETVTQRNGDQKSI